MPVSNPFFHRGPVRRQDYFFGRTHQTRQMLTLLGNNQSVSLVGQRRIGKTSLLFHIAEPAIFEPYGLDPNEHLFVYIDCGGLSDLDQPGLYRVILEEIEDAAADHNSAILPSEPARLPQSITYRAFERALRRFVRQGRKVTIILDEFERMSLNPHLDPDFFSGLRALAARYPIAFVTASKQPLLDLTYANASALSSPFFNIFASTRLGLFSKDTARRLLTELAAKVALDFPPPLLNFIDDLAGLHPLFLQIAGFHAVDLQQAKNSPLTHDDFPELGRRFRASVEEHFTYYWRNLPPDAQRVLATLPASQHNQPDSLRELEQGCLVVRRSTGYKYLSPTFARFVQAQPVAGLTQTGALLIDEDQRQVYAQGQPLNLPASQYDLLLALIEQAGQVMTPEQLEQAIWRDEYIDDPERLKAVLKGLRRSLASESDRLENVRGVGYIWRA